MKMFYMPITSKKSLNNYKNTIENRVKFNGDKLIYNGKRYGAWGFKNGSANERTYSAINIGDYIFCRVNDKNRYQCFLGFLRVSNKKISENLAKEYWDDKEYKNIIFFDLFIKFDEPFKLSKNRKKIDGLPNSSIWHNGYDMFREWKLKEDGGEEKFLDTEEIVEYFKNIPNQVVYFTNQAEDISCDLKIKEDENNDFITEKEALIMQRRGQEKLKKVLVKKYKKCVLCGIDNISFLIASHIIPWANSNSFEKLDENNALLLCPHHDSLFDKGYITFDQDGKIVISKELDEKNRKLMNINDRMKLNLNEKQKKYMLYHNQNIFKK